MATYAVTSLEAADRLRDVLDLFCRGCGYGIAVDREPPECPMCRSREWSERPGWPRRT